MAESNSNPSLDEGVIFAATDYASLWRRFVIFGVDGLIVLLGWLALAFAWYFLDDSGDDERNAALCWIVFAYVYLTILKRSPIGTVGLRLTGMRLVDFQGRPPSMWQMTYRVMLWVLGPMNPVIDLFWLGGDVHRQSLRDKFAGTYVVKRGATPIARGVRTSKYYNFYAATMAFWELRPVREDESG